MSSDNHPSVSAPADESYEKSEPSSGVLVNLQHTPLAPLYRNLVPCRTVILRPLLQSRRAPDKAAIEDGACDG